MREYDVIVIGAGIHGAGVAQAASAAGHQVLVLEQAAPAHGTSSRSSKLIHGGLRYLESGQFSLVRESLHERTLMLRNAPELVRLQPFHIPIYAHTRRRPWQIGLGLSLYATLGGFAPGCGFGLIPRRDWSKLDGLDTNGLKAVFRYYDGQTDDALLTGAVLRSAQTLGAELLDAARVTQIELQGQDHGAVVTYTQQSTPHQARGRVVVNATGPWVNQLLHLVHPAQPLRLIELIQGTHLLVPGTLSRGIYYVESPRDGRAVFVMPWYGQTLIGTTETPFRGDPERVQPTTSEVNYLLNVLRHYFPTYRDFDARQILRSFAGLRVLPAGGGHAFHRPRETLLEVDRELKPQLLSILGGKLTGWRATADKVLTRISASLPVRKAVADTRQLRLYPP